MNFITNCRNIYPYVKPYLFRAILAILITVPLGSMDAIVAGSLKPYIDVIISEKSTALISLFSFLIITFSLLQSFLNYAAIYLNKWVGTKITMDLKKDLFKKMMRYEASFFDKSTSGTIMIRFNQDADLACSGLLSNFKLFTTRFISSITLIFVLIYNSWQLSIIAIVVLLAALFPLTQIRKRIKSIMHKTIMSDASVMTHYNEAFAGNRVIASFNLYSQKLEQFRESLRSVFSINMDMTKKTGILAPMMHFIVSIGIAGVVWLGTYFIANDQLTTGGFISFISALLMLYHPIKSLGSDFTSLQMSFLAIERVFSLLSEKPKIRSKENALKINTFKSEISFKNVCFQYEINRPILQDISLTIAKGKTIALVGNSGGGKSTLMSLLPRFYDVNSGTIEIDGIDIRDIDIDNLRDLIAIVFQDNILFAGTIRDNILLGKSNATEEELNKAVRNACLDEFIKSLPSGLDTEIGERGIKLSGGQKQRIAIARAFLKDAPIVILDEATSALDNKSEEIVQQAIYNLMKDRTVFVIAHRLSTVKNADTIVVINHGYIKEQGTHEELLNKENSTYAALYKTQIETHR